MLQTEWIRAKDVLAAIAQAARHDMDPKQKSQLSKDNLSTCGVDQKKKE